MVKCCAPKYTGRDLRTTCQFQRKTRTSDGAGGWTEAWESLADAATRGMFRAMSGGERFQAMRVESTTRNRLVVRYFAGLVESDRVLIDGKRYNITFINNLDMDDRWFEIDLDGGVST